MLAEADRLRGLIKEYGVLRRLEGHTPQSRGQRFNGLIAEVLQCWGINADSDLDARGNIDVVFSISGTRYILEAKWEDAPADTGKVAKLQKRIRQRLGGTVGVALAMSGFSPGALSDLREGERLEVLLIERPHFEAMLSGFVPPQELFPLLLDRASFRGEVGGSLLDLLRQAEPDLSAIRFGSPSELDALVAEPSSLQCSVALSNLPSGQSGVAERSPGVLLLTLTGGLVEVDLREESATTILPIAGCSRNVVVAGDDSIYCVRRFGVGQLSGDRLRVIEGGLTGNVALVPGPNGDQFAFANSRSGGPYMGGDSLVVRLGSEIGDGVIHAVDYPSAHGTNAAWVTAEELLVVGAAGVVGGEIGGPSRQLAYDLLNPMGLIRIDKTHVMVAAGEVSLIELDLEAEAAHELVRLNLLGSISELTPSAEANLGGYLFSHYTNDRREMKGIVVAFRQDNV